MGFGSTYLFLNIIFRSPSVCICGVCDLGILVTEGLSTNSSRSNQPSLLPSTSRHHLRTEMKYTKPMTNRFKSNTFVFFSCWVGGRMLVKSTIISFKWNLLSHLPKVASCHQHWRVTEAKIGSMTCGNSCCAARRWEGQSLSSHLPKAERANHYRLSNKSHATTKQAFGALGCDLRICILATDPICILPKSKQSFAEILENTLYFVFWIRSRMILCLFVLYL